MIDASVVICTFNRPALLGRAVRSCLAQASRLAFEVIVVDNSRDGNAAAQTEALAKLDSRVRYVGLPRPNISLARNAGFAAARGDYLAFLDDDEEADARWLDDLVGIARATGAAGVFGPVLPRFESGPPGWDRTGWYFTRNCDLPPGTVVDVVAKPRATARWIGTGNSLIRRSAVEAGREPFDQRYGRTGGEDTEFFERLQRHGHRIVWCGSAVVHEFVPDDRASLAYMLDRKRRGAQLFVSMMSGAERRPWLTLAAFMARGAAQTVFAALVGLTVGIFLPSFGVRARFHAAAGLGMLTWWQRAAPPV